VARLHAGLQGSCSSWLSLSSTSGKPDARAEVWQGAIVTVREREARAVGVLVLLWWMFAFLGFPLGGFHSVRAGGVRSGGWRPVRSPDPGRSN
jgi:hypothetical protein